MSSKSKIQWETKLRRESQCDYVAAISEAKKVYQEKLVAINLLSKLLNEKVGD